MLAARIGLSLKSKIAANVAIVLAIITIFLWVFIPLELNDLAVTWAERRGTGIALVLARSLEPSLDFDDATSARELLKGLEAAPGALYGVLYRGDQVALAAWRGELAPKLKDKIATEVVVAATAERLDILAPVSVKGGAPGMLALGFSLEEMQRETRRNSFIVGLVLLVFFAVGLVVSFAIGTLTVRPVRALTALSTHIVETGDLTQSVEVTTQDEVGQLARAFHQMVTGQRTVMLSVKDLAAGLSQVIEHSSRVAEGVVTGSETVRSRTLDTSSAMQRSLASLRDIAENADAMQAAAAESTLAITEMGGVMRLVKDSITAMVSATEETAAAIEQMNRGVTETSRNLSDVSSLLGDTSAAMGKDLQAAVEAMADAVTGENERLKEFGIKASTNGGLITYQFADRAGLQRTATALATDRAAIQQTLERIVNEGCNGLICIML